MTREEKECIKWLIEQIQTERDQKRFNDFVTELNQILARKEARLTGLPDSATQSQDHPVRYYPDCF